MILFPAARAAETPWTPEKDEARRTILQELSKPEYVEQRRNPLSQWLEDAWNALVAWLSGVDGGGMLPGWLILVVVGVLAVVLLLWLRPRFGSSGARDDDASHVVDTALSAAQYRAAGDAALQESRATDAVLAYYRALIRESQHRVLLQERASLTATEASFVLGSRFPDHRERLRRAAIGFNDIAYGHREASLDQAREFAALERDVRETEPAPASYGNEPSLVVPR